MNTRAIHDAAAPFTSVTALALAPVSVSASAQTRDPDTPPAGGVPDPDGPVTADALARGDIDVPGVPLDDDPFREFGIADRLEYPSNDGDAKYVRDAFAYAGGDYHRLWIETEGEGSFDGDAEAVELQVLYSLALTPYWNAQIGLRHDVRPEPATDYLVLGAGITDYSADLRLRYEIAREFAPYIGLSWFQKVGERAELMPEDEDAGTLSGVAGVRAWF